MVEVGLLVLTKLRMSGLYSVNTLVFCVLALRVTRRLCEREEHCATLLLGVGGLTLRTKRRQSSQRDEL